MADYRGDDTTGFQSPAQDYVEPVIDLSEVLGLRRPGLYPVRFVSQELRARGIHAGDILITDADVTARDGQVCVVSCMANGCWRRWRARAMTGG